MTLPYSGFAATKPMQYGFSEKGARLAGRKYTAVLTLKSAGFTLIEILTALVILAIIGSITVLGLQTAIRAQDIINQKASRLSVIQSAIIIMERDLEQIINRPVMDGNGSLLPAVMVRYAGGKASLEFTRTGYINPFSTYNRTTLQRVTYFWDGKSLLRSTWLVLDRVPGSTIQTQILIPHVTSFTILFMDQSRQMRPAEETPTLPTDSQQKISPPQPPLPMAVEIDLTTEDAGTITRLIPLSG